MTFACIDVGTNTTRLLVAEVIGGRLREVITERVYTRIGKSLASGRRIPADKMAATAQVVARQAGIARASGADRVTIVATAAIRDADNGEDLAAAIHAVTGVPLTVLSSDEEARLSFVGATKTLGAPVDGTIAVIDVGGGSTEIAIGSVRGGVEWSDSVRIGSGMLSDAYVHHDPPGASELQAVRLHVAGAFEGLAIPPATKAVAVGGSATSLRRLVGAELAHETLERAIRILSSTPVAEVARRFELDPERVGMLPAGIFILEEISDRLRLPLAIGKGGLREGVILDLAAR